jgi:hypothetical protein
VEAAALAHTELEEQLDERGRQLLRLLHQDHLDLRAAREHARRLPSAARTYKPSAGPLTREMGMRVLRLDLDQSRRKSSGLSAGLAAMRLDVTDCLPGVGGRLPW